MVCFCQYWISEHLLLAVNLIAEVGAVYFVLNFVFFVFFVKTISLITLPGMQAYSSSTSIANGRCVKLADHSVAAGLVE